MSALSALIIGMGIGALLIAVVEYPHAKRDLHERRVGHLTTYERRHSC